MARGDGFAAFAGIARNFGELSRAATNSFDGLLPSHRRNDVQPTIPAREVTIIALRLKHLIESAVPCELKESQVTRPHSEIITREVISLARNAAPNPHHRACIVFCLLVCLRWFKRQAVLELYDADLYKLRASACQVIAKRIIEEEEDQEYLFHDVLLKRYSTLKNGVETPTTNVIEKAVDLHATSIIGSSGFQKAIQWLWRGWIIQDIDNPLDFAFHREIADKSFWAHFNHDRLRAPRYQNAFQILISIIYLILYTIAVNTVNAHGGFDIEEVVLFIFTFSFIIDEFIKFYKVGWWYISFWNTFNTTLYSLLVCSFTLRLVALSHPADSDPRRYWNLMSYNFLAFVAPLMWSRMLLFLDSIRFFGAMLVILKVMMVESIIFFALLIIIIFGFMQGFFGLDAADNYRDDTYFVLSAMGRAILGAPEFDGFGDFGHPFGEILYYLYSFIVMVVLLNILIALYGQAYSDITENSTDEYLALFSHKTLQFVRAPDENVFLPPYNLIEIFCLVLPFEWWMDKHRYARWNDVVMKIIYSPFMLGIAWVEQREARRVVMNRARGEADDDSTEEWEEIQGEEEQVGRKEWREKVEGTVTDVEEDKCCQMVRKLMREVEELRREVRGETVEPEGQGRSQEGEGESSLI